VAEVPGKKALAGRDSDWTVTGLRSSPYSQVLTLRLSIPINSQREEAQDARLQLI